MKTIKLITLSSLLLITPFSFSADSMNNLSQSFTHSGQAIKHGAMASGQITSAIVAVPLKAVGAVGKLSDKAGDSLLEIAEGNEKLEISEEVVTLAPSPKIAMQDELHR
ncbi:MAG: hypothetical protein IPK77_16110 [Cellvibrio sp.]|nr:hypothetical protein [Cellvibrio sp.]